MRDWLHVSNDVVMPEIKRRWSSTDVIAATVTAAAADAASAGGDGDADGGVPGSIDGNQCSSLRDG